MYNILSVCLDVNAVNLGVERGLTAWIMQHNIADNKRKHFILRLLDCELCSF